MAGLVRTKLKDFTKQNKTDSTATQLVNQAKTIQDDLLEVEKTLYQTQNRSNQDPLNFPIRLTNKLGHLNRLLTIDDFPPTNQDIAVKEELTAAIKMAMKQYQTIIDSDVASFNELFKKEKRNYLGTE